MTFEDRDYISQQDEHELNYVLKKYGKRQTQGNRDRLVELLGAFRDDASYAPHKRDDFYRYVDATKSFDAMEA